MKFLFAAFAVVAMLFSHAAVRAQEKVDLEIGYMPILPVSQLFVTLERGWMDEAGVQPKLVQFQNGPAMVQALLAGQLDVAYFGIGPAMVARAKGADIKIVASNVVEQISLVALGELAPYFEDDHKTAFARFAAAKGRKPVITTFPTGSVPETVLQYWLRRQLEIDPSQVEIIQQGAAQVQQALLTGAVDGAAILEPIVTTVLARKPDARVIASGSEMFPRQPGAVLAVRAETLAGHRPQIVALVAAHRRATTFLVEQPADASGMVGKYVGGGRLPRELVQAALERSKRSFVSDPNLIVGGAKAMHDFQRDLGTLRQPVDLEALFDVSLYAETSGD